MNKDEENGDGYAKKKNENGETSRCDEAYKVLKRRILTNQIPPGHLIDDRELAHELGMSRTPVREALLRLQSEGFVEMAPRRGTRVIGISRETMREVYEIISGLELIAVDLLANRKPDADELAPLNAALEAMRNAQTAQDIEAWMDADDSFHRGLLEKCGNRRLTEIGFLHREQVQRAHLIAVRLCPAERRDKSIASHQLLLDLLAKGDVKGARDAHYHQRVNAGEELIETLKRYGLNNL